MADFWKHEFVTRADNDGILTCPRCFYQWEVENSS
jgi:uncharacterized C2H2 Zn-finger protein